MDMPPQEAKTIAAQIRFYYVAKLRPKEKREWDRSKISSVRYTDVSGYVNDATMDNPVEETSMNHEINVDILQIWIVINDSGKVLKKIILN